MKNRTFSKNKLTVIEFENLYEAYTGVLYGYKIKAEYAYKKSQQSAIYHHISIVCREIMPKSPQVNAEVLVECEALGIKEKSNFIISNRLSELGTKDFCSAIVIDAFGKLKILEKSNEKEEESK